MPVSGGGAVPSVVERWKPKVIVVDAPSRSGLNDALSVACSVAASAPVGASAQARAIVSAASAASRGITDAQSAVGLKWTSAR
jgi:hypothetical protein